MSNASREYYYEKTDFSDLIKRNGQSAGKNAKRITLNISGQIYDEANELDSYMRMGYQNVLKTAMTIGLTELCNQVSNHTVKKKTAHAGTSLKPGGTMVARSKNTTRHKVAAIRKPGKS